MNKLQRLEKMRQALELRQKGVPLEAIGIQLGYTTKPARHAREWLEKALREAIEDDADTMRAQEARRLDAILAAWWDKAVSGDFAATQIVLDVIRLRIRLYGLDKQEHAPKNVFQQAVIVLPDNQRQFAVQPAAETTVVPLLPR